MPILTTLKTKAEDFSRYMASGYADRTISSMIDHLFDVLIMGKESTRHYGPFGISEFSTMFSSFRTSIKATTGSGYTFHILSLNPFHDALFSQSDEANVLIYLNYGRWHFEFQNAFSDCGDSPCAKKFYFSMPNEILEEKKVINNAVAFREKDEMFGVFFIHRRIPGVERTPKLKFEMESLLGLLSKYNGHVSENKMS